MYNSATSSRICFAGQTPASTAPPVNGAAPPGTQRPPISYTVQTGDTLAKIAKDCKVNLENVKKLNPEIQNPDDLKPGQTIKLPGRAQCGELTAKALLLILTLQTI